ncbi:phage holin family protein [Pseudorhodobacter sp.]|jgi:membrane protein implicated in regulation of membrane protease activity|uniref:phage holin family protein n=1 Tax=Pseudorhodobacter sp. TaxID=1934400 RepID=UPI002AFF223B|nr:phage holin family protein [Pseudorhodobacter sp.]
MMPDAGPKHAGGLILQALCHLRRIFAAELALTKLDIRAAIVAAILAVVFCCLAVIIALVAVMLLGMAVASALVANGVAPWMAQLVTSAGFLVAAGAAFWGAIRFMRRVLGLPGRVYTRIVEDLERVLQAVAAGEEDEAE